MVLVIIFATVVAAVAAVAVVIGIALAPPTALPNTYQEWQTNANADANVTRSQQAHPRQMAKLVRI